METQDIFKTTIKIGEIADEIVVDAIVLDHRNVRKVEPGDDWLSVVAVDENGGRFIPKEEFSTTPYKYGYKRVINTMSLVRPLVTTYVLDRLCKLNKNGFSLCKIDPESGILSFRIPQEILGDMKKYWDIIFKLVEEGGFSLLNKPTFDRLVAGYYSKVLEKVWGCRLHESKNDDCDECSTADYHDVARFYQTIYVDEAFSRKLESYDAFKQEWKKVGAPALDIIPNGGTEEVKP